LQAIVFGPEDTPYENGVFFLDITLPLEYPFRPPMVKFKTKIFHPNFIINENCHYAVKELSKDWNPHVTISKIVNKIYSLLKKPNMDCENDSQNLLHFHHHHSIKKNIFNKECLKIMKENYENYEKIAKEWTIKFAQK
jgi:ubiquitin-conjugating enzyme E2 D/E